MARQIIRCPDGRWNVWSTISDDWLSDVPCSEAGWMEWFLRDEMSRARERVEEIRAMFNKIKEGGNPYAQFRMTYEEAEETRASVHGKRRKA